MAVQEEVFKRREDGLKKKDLELQESLIRFSKFLQVTEKPASIYQAGCHAYAKELLGYCMRPAMLEAW